MDPTQRLRAIFDEAAERPISDRVAFVHSACAGNAQLEQEVLSLLEALATKADPLEADLATWLAMDDAALSGSGDSDGSAQGSAIDLQGTVVGDFRLLRLIGRGSMGSVYEAEQTSLHRPAAVKLLQSWTASRDSRRRFVEEASILARLHHPGIAQVIAAGTRELDLSGPDKSLAEGLFNDLHSVPWIAMELVEGGRTILDACRGLPLDALLRTFALIADSVHYGHQQGVIHRDLKPANILVNDQGEPKVIDFGVARALRASTMDKGARTHSRSGSFLGTPRYMSPEQCDGRGAPVDTRSDVYSLGVVLYEAMTGVPPYGSSEDSVVACMQAIREQPARDPRQISRAIPTDAAMVVLKSLSKDTEDRYQSAAEFASDLRRILSHEPIAARRRSMLYATSMLVRRRPVIAAMTGLAALGVVVGIVGVLLGLSRERAARREADRVAWLANLTAADLSLRLGNGGAAMRRLDSVPSDKRGWEWQYLHASADTSIEARQITSERAGTFLSPSGRWAMCHFVDGRAFLQDLRTRKTVVTVAGVLPSAAAAWSADERSIIIPRKEEVILLDGTDGQVVRRFPQDPNHFPLGAALSPDGSLLAVGLSDMFGIRVYRVQTGEELFSHPSEGWVYGVQFTPDGRTLVWSDVSSVKFVDTAAWSDTGTVLTGRITGVEPGGIDISPDGKTIAVICGDFAQLVDVPSMSVRASLHGHAQRIHTIRFDAAGDRLVTTSIDRTVRIWNAANAELITTLLGHESPTLSASFSTGPGMSGQTVESVDADNRVRTWNLAAQGPVAGFKLVHCAALIDQLDFVSKEKVLRVMGSGSAATIALSDESRRIREQGFDSNDMCFLPGQDLMLRNIDGRHIVLDAATTGARVWSVETDASTKLVVSPDARLFTLSKVDGSVALARVADGVELGSFVSSAAAGHWPMFSPDGKLLLVPINNGSTRLYLTASCSLVAELAPPGDRGHGLAWSDDGTWFAYCHAADGITVCETQTRKPVARINGIGGFVWSIAISPDKTRIAIGAQDRITHLYELPSGDELIQLRDHTGSVMCIAWSPDGRYLATGGYDKRVFLYDAKPVDLAKEGLP